MHKFFLNLSRMMAAIGGIVLSALILLTCLSIAGRLLNTLFHGPLFQTVLPKFSEWAIAIGVGPVNGDFEIVEAGIAFAIFAFLPICQITAGHAKVDIFTAHLPERADRLLRCIIEIVFALALITIAMQLHEGMQSKMRSGQTTFLLQFPLWWSYGASLVGAVIAAVTGIYMAGVRCAECLRNRQIVADPGEVSH